MEAGPRSTTSGGGGLVSGGQAGRRRRRRQEGTRAGPDRRATNSQRRHRPSGHGIGHRRPAPGGLRGIPNRARDAHPPLAVLQLTDAPASDAGHDIGGIAARRCRVVEEQREAGRTAGSACSASPVASNAVWGASANDAWAVGDVGTTIVHWDGTAVLSNTAPAGAGQLRAIWARRRTTSGRSASRRRSSGGYGTMVHRDPPAPATQGIWGASANAIWVVGTYGIYHWDGTAWSMAQMAPAMNTVWGASATDVWAAGGGAEPRFIGTAWPGRRRQRHRQHALHPVGEAPAVTCGPGDRWTPFFCVTGPEARSRPPRLNSIARRLLASAPARAG